MIRVTIGWAVGVVMALLAVYVAGWLANRKDGREVIPLGGVTVDGRLSIDGDALSEVPDADLALITLGTVQFLQRLEAELEERTGGRVAQAVEDEEDEWARIIIDSMKSD